MCRTKNCSTCDGSRIHDGTRYPKDEHYKGKMYCIFWGDGMLGEWTEPYGFCHKWKPKKPELWATGKTYAKGEQVVFGDVVYQVLVGHESSEFNVPGMCEKYKPIRKDVSMKAYKCDACGYFIEGRADGVLYDNREIGKGERYDICPECTEKAMRALFGERADNSVPEHESEC